MPELGKYAAEVASAYGVTFLLLVIVSIFYWQKSRTFKRRLLAVEMRKDA
jgi:heme exporter protein D